jgi:hypothetical protein
MSIKHLAWASEQSSTRPAAKLLAIFLASNHGIERSFTFHLQDAASWCCCNSIEMIEDLLTELEREAGLTVERNWKRDRFDMTATVKIPEAQNGGELL